MAPPIAAAAVGAPSFIAASHSTGKRQGYVYMKGSKGHGYYREIADDAMPGQHCPTSSSHVTLITSGTASSYYNVENGDTYRACAQLSKAVCFPR